MGHTIWSKPVYNLMVQKLKFSRFKDYKASPLQMIIKLRVEKTSKYKFSRFDAHYALPWYKVIPSRINDKRRHEKIAMKNF